MKIKSVTGTSQIRVAATLFVCLALEAFAATTRVVNPADANAYPTISAAVAASTSGDTVLVYPGTYQENVTINNGIILRGLSGPEVTVIKWTDGLGGTGVTLNGTGNMSLIGFQVQGFITGIYVNTSGASVTKVANCIATGNSGEGFLFGASMPSGAKILNNIAARNGGHGFNFSANCSYSYTGSFNDIAYRNGGCGFRTGCNCNSVGDYHCAFANNSGAVCNACSLGSNSFTTDPMLDESKSYRFSSTNSLCINAGNLASAYNDPDNSRNDMGAYGGPDAYNWWRSPVGGPTIQNVTVNPPQVAPGGTVTIRATATAQ